MPDMFEMMIGAPPSGPEETRATAEQLRREQRQGMLGISTGDRVMGQMGQTMQSGVGDQIANIRKEQAAMQAQENWEEKMQFDRDKMAENSALRKSLQEMKNQATSKEDRRYRQALSRDLTKAGIPEMMKGMDIVDAALLPYEGKNIPGFGAGKFNPSDEARAMRGKLAGVENVLLHARSGAAVTEPEFQRFRKELLGEGWLASDADFRRSWADLKAKIKAKEEGITDGYDPEIVDMYYGVENVSDAGNVETVMGDAMSYLGQT